MRHLLILTAFLTVAGPAATAQTATGEPFVAMRVITFDDPLDLLFESPLHSAPVFAGVEFTVGPTGNVDLDVVPVSVDVGEGRIDVSYPDLDGLYDFAQASFNGYELTFEPCVEFRNLTVLTAGDIGMDRTRIWSDENRLYISVSGLVASDKSRFSVGYTTAPCGVS